MSRVRLVLLALIVAGIVLASSFSVIWLRAPASAPSPSVWAYRANWSCTNATNTGQAESIGLVSGEYGTRISVLNPSTTAVSGSFVESIARGSVPSVIFKYKSASLNWTVEPGASLYIDCNTLSSLYHFSINDPFSIPTGFASLTTNSPSLNVVASYTAESFNATGIPTGVSIEVHDIVPAPVN